MEEELKPSQFIEAKDMDTAYDKLHSEIEKTYFLGIEDALKAVKRYGCDIGDSKDHINGVIQSEKAIKALLKKETMEDARNIIEAWTNMTEEQKQAAKFYGVKTLSELVDAQAHHIEKLQAKLPEMKGEFYPTNPRKG